jgi:hypothetical protein
MPLPGKLNSSRIFEWGFVLVIGRHLPKHRFKLVAYAVYFSRIESGNNLQTTIMRKIDSFMRREQALYIRVFLTFVCHWSPTGNFYTTLSRLYSLQIMKFYLSEQSKAHKPYCITVLLVIPPGNYSKMGEYIYLLALNNRNFTFSLDFRETHTSRGFLILDKL